jgi:uncharacterized membrane protein YidH (DUF202 family)
MRLDPGLQAERTLLAWQRTSLSVAAGGALLLHLSAERLGTFGVAAGIAALCVSMAAHLASRRRYSSLHRDLYGFGRVQDAGVACALVSLAAIALAAVAVGLWIGRAADVAGQ